MVRYQIADARSMLLGLGFEGQPREVVRQSIQSDQGYEDVKAIVKGTLELLAEADKGLDHEIGLAIASHGQQNVDLYIKTFEGKTTLAKDVQKRHGETEIAMKRQIKEKAASSSTANSSGNKSNRGPDRGRNRSPHRDRSRERRDDNSSRRDRSRDGYHNKDGYRDGYRSRGNKKCYDCGGPYHPSIASCEEAKKKANN